MNFQRSSGVLLHVTSLPSYGGIGDLGPAAHEFLAFLAAAGQHIWQVLPLCPTGYGNSPYASNTRCFVPELRRIAELEHQLRVTEPVIKFITVRIDE